MSPRSPFLPLFLPLPCFSHVLVSGSMPLSTSALMKPTALHRMIMFYACQCKYLPYSPTLLLQTFEQCICALCRSHVGADQQIEIFCLLSFIDDYNMKSSNRKNFLRASRVLVDLVFSSDMPVRCSDRHNIPNLASPTSPTSSSPSPPTSPPSRLFSTFNTATLSLTI